MKRFLKAVAVAILIFITAISAMLIEHRIRAGQRSSLEISGLPIEGATVKGNHIPDFGWVGRAWWIDIDTEKPLLLRIDDWVGQIPPGSHKIFSNHDATNRADYGEGKILGLPKSILVEVLSEAP